MARKKDLISKVATGAFKIGRKEGRKIGKIQTRKKIKQIMRQKRLRTAPSKLLPEQQRILSKEQQMLNNMFGGSVGRLVLLDRPGQFFDGSNFPFARSLDRNTAAMFGGQGYETRKFFLPTKSRRPTI